MIVYRIGKSRYARDLSGEGARLCGGRWNHKGIPCIYTSGSRALAVLEYTVNVNIEDIPRYLSVTIFEIPDTGIQEITVDNLPGNWHATPAPGKTKEYGTRLLAEGDYPVIKIPSAVIPEEFNYILNPLHPLSDIRIVRVADFIYDVRIKAV